MLELEDEIHTRVQNELDKSQREYYLREQMKQIQTELGEGDIFTRDTVDLKKRLETTVLPDEVRKAAKEVGTLQARCRLWRQKWVLSAHYIDLILTYRGITCGR